MQPSAWLLQLWLRWGAWAPPVARAAGSAACATSFAVEQAHVGATMLCPGQAHLPVQCEALQRRQLACQEHYKSNAGAASLPCAAFGCIRLVNNVAFISAAGECVSTWQPQCSQCSQCRALTFAAQTGPKVWGRTGTRRQLVPVCVRRPAAAAKLARWPGHPQHHLCWQRAR